MPSMVGIYGKDLWGVPIKIELLRGAKQGWVLSLLRESGTMTSRHRNRDLLTFRLCLSVYYWLLIILMRIP